LKEGKREREREREIRDSNAQKGEREVEGGDETQLPVEKRIFPLFWDLEMSG
jgi:hypothetical protein